MILDSIQWRDSALSSNIFYSSQHHSISFLRFTGIHLVYTTRSWWYYHHNVVVETNWIPIWTMATGFKNSRWLRKQLFIKIDSLRLHQCYSWACRCCAFQPLLWDKGLNLPAAAKAGGSSEFAESANSLAESLYFAFWKILHISWQIFLGVGNTGGHWILKICHEIWWGLVRKPHGRPTGFNYNLQLHQSAVSARRTRLAFQKTLDHAGAPMYGRVLNGSDLRDATKEIHAPKGAVPSRIESRFNSWTSDLVKIFCRRGRPRMCVWPEIHVEKRLKKTRRRNGKNLGWLWTCFRWFFSWFSDAFRFTWWQFKHWLRQGGWASQKESDFCGIFQWCYLSSPENLPKPFLRKNM